MTRPTAKYAAGQVWVRQLHGKDEQFTVIHYEPHPSDYRKELLVEFEDGSRVIWMHPHTMKTLNEAVRLL